MIGRIVIYLILGIPLIFLILHTLIRIIRHIYKFPMPEFAANIIDNPIRRRFQPPEATAYRHGIRPGMKVLEVGPGNGTYTMAAAKVAGPEGRIVTIDIEPKMIQRVQRRLEAQDVSNIEARVADVFRLPYPDKSFDLVYMIAVIGEIPTPERALREFHRVLSSNGRLVFSEIFTDPDYPLARNLIRTVSQAGFRLKDRKGNFFYYTLIFEKDEGR